MAAVQNRNIVNENRALISSCTGENVSPCIKVYCAICNAVRSFSVSKESSIKKKYEAKHA
jgi:hypothetical protein